jgi:ribonuclease HI
VVQKQQLQWRSSHGQRTTTHERRVHRTWRCVTQLLVQQAANNVDEGLERHVLRSVQAMRDEGIIPAVCEDLPGVCDFIFGYLQRTAIEVSDERFRVGQAKAVSGHMKGLFDYVGGKARGQVAAFMTEEGRPFASQPECHQAAQAQWEAKLEQPVTEEQRRQYLARVRPFLRRRDLPVDVCRPASARELRQALRETQNSAPGPSQWTAEEILQLPSEARERLLELINVIIQTRRWPEVLRAQEVVMIPKREGSADLRPIGITPVVVRALEKIFVKRYADWLRDIQSTDALDTLLAVDAAIGQATLRGEQLFCRQSDLKNCFTKLDARTAERLAVEFGMEPSHAELLFRFSERRPAVVRHGAVVGGWRTPERGFPQGDPVAPMAAALYAAAHAAVLLAEVPSVELHTYVDDRTCLSRSRQDVGRAAETLAELDRLSGQAEDPKKEETAFIHATVLDVAAWPRASGEYFDLLGVRFDLTGKNPPHQAPRAQARLEEFLTRLTRLRTYPGIGKVGTARVLRVVKATMGLMRWDAPWCLRPTQDNVRIAAALEKVLQGRARYAAWRHRGLSWALLDKGWMVEPTAMTVQAVVSATRKLQCSGRRQAFEAAWTQMQNSAGSICISLVQRLRWAYDVLAWEMTDFPFEVRIQGALVDLGMVGRAGVDHFVREGWRMHVIGRTPTFRKTDVSILNVDIAPLRKFVDGHAEAARSLAWRCVVAAEPNDERLHYVDNSHPHGCARCGDECGDTHHAMWQCPCTRLMREGCGAEENDIAGDRVGPARAAWLQNAWSAMVARPRGADWTSRTLQDWVQRLAAQFRLFPPGRDDDGKRLLAADGSAQAPSNPERRVASWAIAWRTAGGSPHSFSETLGFVENTVNAAELVAVVVGIEAFRLYSADALRILTDHRAVAFPKVRVRTSDGKPELWRRFLAIRPLAEVVWVPAHGRRRELAVSGVWRRLNDVVDRAAKVTSAALLASQANWWRAVVAQRAAAARILTLKMQIFADNYVVLSEVCR